MEHISVNFQWIITQTLSRKRGKLWKIRRDRPVYTPWYIKGTPWRPVTVIARIYRQPRRVFKYSRRGICMFARIVENVFFRFSRPRGDPGPENRIKNKSPRTMRFFWYSLWNVVSIMGFDVMIILSVVLFMCDLCECSSDFRKIYQCFSFD